MVEVDWQKKKQYLILHRNDGNFRRLCAMLRIAPKTGYAWLNRFDSGGICALLEDDPGGRPCKSVPEGTRNAVLALRAEHGWNEKKIRCERGSVSYHVVRQVLAQANALCI